MKRLFILLAIIVPAIILTSCLNWDDDNEPVIYSEAIVNVLAYDTKPVFKTDYSTYLKNSQVITSDTGKIFKPGDRFFIRFQFEDTTNHKPFEYDIKVVEYTKVEVKNFTTILSDTANNFISQPFFFSYRIYLSGDYFNSIVYTYSPLTSLNSMILLRSKYEEDNKPDSEFPTIIFSLIHNAQAVNTGFYNMRLNSFSLASLVNEFPNADSMKIRLSFSDVSLYNQQHDLIYHPIARPGGLDAFVNSYSKTGIMKVR
jgi:hypothetical protein